MHVMTKEEDCGSALCIPRVLSESTIRQSVVSEAEFVEIVSQEDERARRSKEGFKRSGRATGGPTCYTAEQAALLIPSATLWSPVRCSSTPVIYAAPPTLRRPAVSRGQRAMRDEPPAPQEVGVATGSAREPIPAKAASDSTSPRECGHCATVNTPRYCHAAATAAPELPQSVNIQRTAPAPKSRAVRRREPSESGPTPRRRRCPPLNRQSIGGLSSSLTAALPSDLQCALSDPRCVRAPQQALQAAPRWRASPRAPTAIYAVSN
ncbi:hypothetical protein AAFF_G00095550 [Aldrovandia affinis]|uniref:Uncharacterized protein n=1 Tax=Aldrovandia affinis TaxID=143900 RepID=A0AAD7RVG0_9TELE|nr:hypothetical protein AAFF_G00095550 [Aldrovandia affinis]